MMAVDERRKTLWITENVGGRLWKFDLTTGQVAGTFEDLKASAVALDPETGDAWLAAEPELIRVVSPAGTVVATYDIPGYDIAYSPHDQSFWVVGKEIYHVARSGKIMARISGVGWVAVSVSTDRRNGDAWVAVAAHSDLPQSKNELWHLDRRGAPLQRIDLDDHRPYCVRIDASHDIVWVGCRTTTLRFDTNGRKLASSRGESAFSVALTGRSDTAYLADRAATRKTTILGSGRVKSQRLLSDVGDVQASQKWITPMPFTGARLPSSAEVAKSLPTGDEASALALKQLGMTLLTYAADNDAHLPSGLHKIIKRIPPADFRWCLKHSEYTGRRHKTSDPPDTMLAYDKTLLKQGRGTNVLYLDAHVEFLPPHRLQQLGILPPTQTNGPRNSAAGPPGRNALSFDGIDNYLIVPPSPSLALKPPFTIEMWIKPDMPDRQTPPQNKGPYLSLVRKGMPIPNPPTTARYQKGGFVAMVSPPMEGRGRCYGLSHLANEQGHVLQKGSFGGDRLAVAQPGWMHVLMEWRQEDYVPAPDEPLVIGENTAPYGVPYKGQIAEIRIWSRVLTDEEIHHYGRMSLTGNERGLLACWTFAEGTGQTVRDITPNANHAHLGTTANRDPTDPTWVNLTPSDVSDAVAITGQVLDLNGNPVPGTQVALCTDEKHATLLTGTLAPAGSSAEIVETDAAGRFSFSEDPNDFLIVAAHETGFAQVESEALASPASIRLQPWGRVEGTLHTGPEATVGEVIGISQIVSSRVLSKFSYRNQAITKTEGRFVIKKVPPGRLSAYQMKRTGGYSIPRISRQILVQPGETLNIQLGGTGRPVAGRLIIPEDHDSRGEYHCVLDPTDPEPPWPANWDQMSGSQRGQWYQQWRRTSHGQAHRNAIAQDPTRKRYRCRVDRDGGMFRIEDVLPRKYNLNIDFWEEPTTNRLLGPIECYTSVIEVPPMAQAYSDEPLDLGDLVSNTPPTLRAGDMAHNFFARTMDSRDILLTHYRGKFVLMSAWAPTSPPDWDRLKELHETYRHTDKLQVVGLAGLATRDEVEVAVQDNDIPWPQIYFGQNRDSGMARLYATPPLPGAMLIDPNGTIIAAWLRADKLTEIVRNALEKAERDDRVPLKIDYPEPGPDTDSGDPQALQADAGAPLAKDHPAVLVPPGLTNVAKGKPVTPSRDYAIIGEPADVTDGDKQRWHCFEFEPEKIHPHGGAHVTIDLGREYEIFAVAWWHDFARMAVYRDVVVQAATDPQFQDATTLFNNDADNSLELGRGTDLDYIETEKGWAVGANGVRARYIRLHNRGSSRDYLAQYTEVEVYGRLPHRP